VTYGKPEVFTNPCWYENGGVIGTSQRPNPQRSQPLPDDISVFKVDCVHREVIRCVINQPCDWGTILMGLLSTSKSHRFPLKGTFISG